MTPIIDLFNIAGIEKQRAAQCAKCPDGDGELPPEVAETIKPHRCHATPNSLCAGKYRPRILAKSSARPSL